MRRELIEGIAHCHTQLARLDRIVLHVLHRIQTLDDGMAGGFCAQAKLFHFLDQATLRIAGWGLGLVFCTGCTIEGYFLAFFQRRQLLVFLQAIRIDAAKTRLH